MAFKNNKNTEDLINEARGESEKETKERKVYKQPKDYGIIVLYLSKEEKEKIKSIAQKKKMKMAVYIKDILFNHNDDMKEMFGVSQEARSSSSHSFMGEADAEKAEIIAKTLVEFKCEVSMDSAIGKKYEECEKPYETSNGDLPIVKTDKFFEEQKEHREQTKEIQDILDEIDEMQNQFLNNFFTKVQTYIDETDKITQKMIKNIEEGISNYDYLKSQKIIDDSAKDLEAALAEIDDEIEKIIQRNREM